MIVLKNSVVARFRGAAASVVLGLVTATASAALFEDDDARRAILDLRQRVEVIRQEVDALRLNSEQGISRSTEDAATMRRSLLDLQNQLETMRSEMAKLRGVNEQLSRDLADTQRRQKDIAQGVDDRIRQIEPVKVALDGREFVAGVDEKKDYESALATFRKGDFPSAQSVFLEFLKRYPQSGYGPSALFWLGNAQYATRDYKQAIVNFRALIARDPDHLRAPEAVLSVANCQVELKDTRGARKTLEDLLKAYPQSEAAVAAKDRLARLK